MTDGIQTGYFAAAALVSVAIDIPGDKKTSYVGTEVKDAITVIDIYNASVMSTIFLPNSFRAARIQANDSGSILLVAVTEKDWLDYFDEVFVSGGNSFDTEIGFHLRNFAILNFIEIAAYFGLFHYFKIEFGILNFYINNHSLINILIDYNIGVPLAHRHRNREIEYRF